MGNYKFRLSDMMPNAWFYKLKDMGKPRTHNTSSQSQHQIKKKHLPAIPTSQPQFINHRHSYYFTTEPINISDKLYNSPINPKSSDVHFPDPPRKSSRKKPRRKATKSSTTSSKFVTSSVSSGCNCRATLDSVWSNTPDYSPSPDSSPEHNLDGSLFPEFGSESDAFHASWSSSCSCRVSSSTTDIIIDMDSKITSNSTQKLDKFDVFDELELPPILTKPAKFSDMVSEIKNKDTEHVNYRRGSVKFEEKKITKHVSVKEESIKTHKEQKTSPTIRRTSPNSPGMKLRLNSPRIASKKIQAYSRKSISSTTTTKTRKKNLSDSFAIVKSSFDPQRDFRESMVEMIVENNIKASKDLEELLACYLSLNSNEYHDIIVKVFEQIWFDLTDIQL
ncbi:hypothetical protein IFM89_002733 [Coptis chinensis]|uniref:Transcription repressor n=1 Tax=Coptis chinensis TaxID=261450 RepID=A0A835M4I2_9MAGN|nr:hypothetical protein IFM89_002733 [Coptis chinensis]